MGGSCGLNISENGSEEQKRALLPRLARGELLFAYGLSEPDVGGDLASVPTTARRSDDGRRVIVNGTKRWCTGADWADYIYCLVNSDPQAPKRRALSFLLIPARAPVVHPAPARTGTKWMGQLVLASHGCLVSRSVSKAAILSSWRNVRSMSSSPFTRQYLRNGATSKSCSRASASELAAPAGYVYHALGHDLLSSAQDVVWGYDVALGPG